MMLQVQLNIDQVSSEPSGLVKVEKQTESSKIQPGQPYRLSKHIFVFLSIFTVQLHQRSLAYNTNIVFTVPSSDGCVTVVRLFI